jgi:hypothetical protein
MLKTQVAIKSTLIRTERNSNGGAQSLVSGENRVTESIHASF